MSVNSKVQLRKLNIEFSLEIYVIRPLRPTTPILENTECLKKKAPEAETLYAKGPDNHWSKPLNQTFFAFC